MKQQMLRFVSVLLALTTVFSCAGLFASAAQIDAARLIGYDPHSSEGDLRYDADSNTLTMRHRDSLRLMFIGDLPEGASVRWKSDEPDVAAIDADGKIETGKQCSERYLRDFSLVLPGMSPFLTFPRFEGKTTITLEVVDADGTLLQTDSVKLVVEHTFLEWILYRLSQFRWGWWRRQEQAFAA